MAQDNPAQPILKWRDKIASLSDGPPAQKSTDTSWHDDMVKRASESFRKKVSATGTKPATNKAAAKKKATTKKVSAKR